MPSNAQFCFQTGAAFDGFQAGLQRSHQSILLQERRIHFQNEEPHFLQGLEGIVFYFGQVLLHVLVILATDGVAGGCAVQADAIQQLRDRIV